MNSKKRAGGDPIANIVGPPEDGIFLATKALIDAKAITFHGYWKERYRSVIDHVFLTKDMKDQLLDIHVVDIPMARVASDHYPVVAKIKSDPVAKPEAGK